MKWVYVPSGRMLWYMQINLTHIPMLIMLIKGWHKLYDNTNRCGERSGQDLAFLYDKTQ